MSRQTKEILDATPAATLNEVALATVGQAAGQLAVAHETMDEVLAAGIDLGRLEALDFVAVTANTAMLAIFESVKKSKTWRFLRNPASGRNGQFESLEEFCEVKLGKSYKRLRTLAEQKNLLGQDAYEQAERLGLRDKDYNAIKALPAPDKELVRRAVEEAQSRDEVLDLLQELAVRSAKEKQALKAEVDDARDQAAELSDSKKVLEGTVKTLRQQARQFAEATPDEQADILRTKAQGLVAELEAQACGPLFQSLQALMSHGEDAGQSQRAWVKGQLETVLDNLKTVAGRLQVELSLDSGVPKWLDGAAISGNAADAAH